MSLSQDITDYLINNFIDNNDALNFLKVNKIIYARICKYYNKTCYNYNIICDKKYRIKFILTNIYLKKFVNINNLNSLKFLNSLNSLTFGDDFTNSRIYYTLENNHLSTL
jgi:hypothetical protein